MPVSYTCAIMGAYKLGTWLSEMDRYKRLTSEDLITDSSSVFIIGLGWGEEVYITLMVFYWLWRNHYGGLNPMKIKAVEINQAAVQYVNIDGMQWLKEQMDDDPVFVRYLESNFRLDKFMF